MVAARHAKLRATPTTGNGVMQNLRSIWNHARRTRDLPESPTVAIEWYPEEPSQVIVDDLPKREAEVAALGNPIHRVFYRILLTTGFRRTEALMLRWEDVHEDRIHLPVTKNGRPFDLPILGVHHHVLDAVRGLDPTWVLPAWRCDAGHLKSPERISWTAHAHRRTFATIAVHEAGLLEETVGRLLNHTPQTVTGSRYVVTDVDRLREPMRQVVEAMVRLVPSLADPL